MTGLEKVGSMLLTIAGVGITTAQPHLEPAANADWVRQNWPQLVTLVGFALAWGALGQRIKAVEKTQDGLATKESLGALHDKVDTVTNMLNTRIMDRRKE